MTDILISTIEPIGPVAGAEAPPSAVSWPAVFAGVVVALAATLVFVALGAGLGLATASPWPGARPSVAAFSIGVGVWLILTQWAASGVGGYLTGRLRVRWAGLHDHEVFFRDTAHGFITWSLATVIGALILTAAGAERADMAARQSPGLGPDSYAVASLLRSNRAEDDAAYARTRSEVALILATDTVKGDAPEADRDYLAALVAARTGLSPADARVRVDATIAQLRQAAEAARKGASAFLIFTALSMLIGALIACVAAALGGQQRDEHA